MNWFLYDNGLRHERFKINRENINIYTLKKYAQLDR